MNPRKSRYTLKEAAMLFICYPKCSTCQKARNWLDEREVNYTFRDIRQDNPKYDELKEWLSKSELPVKRFFNTSGLAYKALGLKEKLPTMTEDECLALLATDGMLVKRPILVGGDFVLVGFKVDEWKRTLERV
jgi:arsenate reductase